MGDVNGVQEGVKFYLGETTDGEEKEKDADGRQEEGCANDGDD